MQTVFRDALATMQTAFPNASVSVIIDETTGTGLKQTDDASSNAVNMGEMGQTSSGVRVSMATFTTPPAAGKTIVVDGDKVTVTQVREDNSGATMLITYLVQQAAV